MTLESSVTEIKGVGDEIASKLAKLKIKNVRQLLEHYPTRYIDFSNLIPIKEIKPGTHTIKVKFRNIKSKYVRRGMHITEVVAYDNESAVSVIWFNQPFRKNSIKNDIEYYLSGEYKLNGRKFGFLNPSIELVSDHPVNTARILPVYKLTEGLNPAIIRKAVTNALKHIEIQESIPDSIIEKYKLITIKNAFEFIHYPMSMLQINQANMRFSFDEIFEMMLASKLNKLDIQKLPAHKIEFDINLAKSFVEKLPYKLTDDQRRAIWQIYKDIDSKIPMNRLVDGDVGSGKTVIAAMAALMVMSKNKQVALMAPTEILASQHANTINNLFKPLGLDKKITLLSSSLSKKDKEKAIISIKNSDSLLIIGTHALIEDYVEIEDLALVIVDEQHRFGVKQRQKLLSKAKKVPHFLSLSATPIPRSLALTLFKELDITKLRSVPNKDKIIHTNLISRSEYLRSISEIKEQVLNGDQMFVVCPSISSSQMSSVDEVYDDIKEKYKECNIAKLHGKMSQTEKDEVMKSFLNKDIDILVATTVIEVGVDVPNANIMLIFSPNRFGLAQLHQVRGRVGRGKKPGYCYLISEDTDPVSSRLRAIEQYSDGFKLAQIDLDLRGPGHIYGVFQHGDINFKKFNLNDQDTIEKADKATDDFIKQEIDLLQYPLLKKKIDHYTRINNLN